MKLDIRKSYVYKKTLIMRLIIVILIATFMQVNASTYAQRISINKSKAHLKSVLKELGSQSGYDLMYTDDLIKGSKPVSIHLKDAVLDDVLKEIFSDQPLTYVILQKTIVIREKEKTLLDNIVAILSVINVRGRVVDEEGKPLAGATISVVKMEVEGDQRGKKNGDFSLIYKGRNVAASTDANGEFSLNNVDDKSFIIISYIGYQVFQTEAKKDLGTIKMVLRGNLDEVNVTVNTGYQSIARERSAGAIAKPNMEIFKNRSGSMDVIQRLDGLVPGLVINNSASPTGNIGSDGTRGSSVLIRGLTTVSDFTNRDPLIVVNGVPVTDASSVNPNDVEDITVLKDATSASIWGAKAANGVIVITTKKGTSGGSLKINYDGFINFQGKPDLAYQNKMNAKEYIQTVKEIFDDPLYKKVFLWDKIIAPSFGTAAVSPHEAILYNPQNLPADAVNAKLDQLSAQNNLNEIKDLWYRNAILMNHSLSVAGGSEKYSVYGSVNYTKTLDNFPGSKNDNYNLNLRQDFKFNNRIKMYLITDIQNSVKSSINNITPITADFLPYAMFKNENGSNADMSWLYRTDELRKTYEDQSLVSLKYNPLDEINTANSSNNLFGVGVNSGVTLKIIDGLRYEGIFGIRRAQNKSVNFKSENNYDVRSELTNFTIAGTNGGKPTYLLPQKGGTNAVANSLSKSWTVRNQLIYDKNWQGNNHQLTVLIGQEDQEQFYNNVSTLVRGYNQQLLTRGSVDFKALANGVSTIMPNGFSNSSLRNDSYGENETLSRITSWYGNAGYTYLDKYTVNTGLRMDQSNLFGKDKSAQNRPVWNAGLVWQAGKEDFIRNVKWLDRLVIRTSYGLTGNSPNVGTASSKDILSSLSNSDFPEGAVLNLTSPANRGLSWETTKNLNFGLDFSILKRRINGTIDLYQKKTDNMIGEMFLNPLTSFPTITGNAGDMTNRGIDVNISSINLADGAFKWSSILTMSFNKNKITSLNRSSPIIFGSDKVDQPYLEGYPAFSTFAYTFAGLDRQGDPQIKMSDGSITKVNNASMPEDVKFMGTFQPKWSGGLNNVFGYYNFSLSLNMIYNFGAVMRNDVGSFFSGRLYANSNGFNGNLSKNFLNRWKKEGDELITNVPAYNVDITGTVKRSTEYYAKADINVLDASYVKLRDVTLSYSLPKLLLNKFQVDGLTLRAQLSNVMLWKANDAGIDPEFINGRNGTRSLKLNQHTFTLGAHLTF